MTMQTLWVPTSSYAELHSSGLRGDGETVELPAFRFSDTVRVHADLESLFERIASQARDTHFLFSELRMSSKRV